MMNICAKFNENWTCIFRKMRTAQRASRTNKHAWFIELTE